MADILVGSCRPGDLRVGEKAHLAFFGKHPGIAGMTMCVVYTCLPSARTTESTLWR